MEIRFSIFSFHLDCGVFFKIDVGSNKNEYQWLDNQGLRNMSHSHLPRTVEHSRLTLVSDE